jgi:hypothetical protein
MPGPADHRRGVEYEGVGAISTGQSIAAALAEEHVVADTARDGIITLLTKESIVAALALQRVVEARAVIAVVRSGARDRHTGLAQVDDLALDARAEVVPVAD